MSKEKYFALNKLKEGEVEKVEDYLGDNNIEFRSFDTYKDLNRWGVAKDTLRKAHPTGTQEEVEAFVEEHTDGLVKQFGKETEFTIECMGEGNAENSYYGYILKNLDNVKEEHIIIGNCEECRTEIFKDEVIVDEGVKKYVCPACGFKDNIIELYFNFGQGLRD